jgi:hypothetical protein
MNILLDFNAKVVWEDIFKATAGNESLCEISNDSRIRVGNFATSENLTVKSTMFTHRNFKKVTFTTTGGKTDNQIDHILLILHHSNYTWLGEEYKL